MIQLMKSVQAWSSSEFESVLKNEVKALGLAHLPLQQGLSSSSVALDRHLALVVLRVQESHDLLNIKMGAFYTGIIAGCGCADDPSPNDEVNEYCEFELELNLANGQAVIELATNTN